MLPYARRVLPWAKETIGLSARLCLLCYQPATTCWVTNACFYLSCYQPTLACLITNTCFCLVTNAPNGATSSQPRVTPCGHHVAYLTTSCKDKSNSVQLIWLNVGNQKAAFPIRLGSFSSSFRQFLVGFSTDVRCSFVRFLLVPRSVLVRSSID